MHRLQQLTQRAKARVLRIGPDRFWLLQCVVVGAALFLLGVIFDLHRQMADGLGIRTMSGRIADLWAMQSFLLTVVFGVLSTGCLLILLPTRLIVQSHLQALRKRTARLTQSKLQLEQVNAQLRHMTTHDALTGLPNRAHLIDELRAMMAAGQATDCSFLVIGLDGFKTVNDSYGPEFGDLLLIAVGQELRHCVDDDQIVARVGGDEFVVMTNEPGGDIVKRVQASFSHGFDVGGRHLPVRASIGHLVIGADQADPLTVLADAVMALQIAKNDGGQRAQRFTPDLRDHAGLLQRLQMELPDAIRNGEFEPWFQPQVRLTDGTLHGVEVLARWRHPTRGLLTPDRFLAIAERTGMIIEMDHVIWQAAMQHAMEWQEAEIWHPVISLNAAPDTISDPFLIERFLMGLRKSGLSAEQVIVEVLETTLIDGTDNMAAINIDSLAECGIALELDDFGTGYASLCRLTQLPLSGIKLDKSLVAPLPDQGADSVVRAILALAAELGLHVVAEGVEGTGQAQHLFARGCEIGQGYGFARPMPAPEFRLWLAQYAKGPVGITDNPGLAKQA